jgi:hypothetical protein
VRIYDSAVLSVQNCRVRFCLVTETIMYSYATTGTWKEILELMYNKYYTSTHAAPRTITVYHGKQIILSRKAI